MRPGISYQYNANGQITSITENNKTNSYEYDGLGRLTRENDEDRNVTICYNYDSNGNILSKVFYPYSTGTLSSATSTISYTYSSTWGDQLLTYNGGSTITYDAIGNPLSYNGMTFTWQKGRQLASANNGTQTFQFTYDQDGNRTWKLGSTTGEQCIYASGLLVYWTDGENIQKFTYDPDGIALGVNLNGTDYYYLYNAQGDVIALYDSTGTIVVEYVYDSWGKVLSVSGSEANTIGALNPLRYRGYFYDTDLGFYLLETRYYDPETGRFINADGIVDNRGVQTTNLYSYCANNPINNKDSSGKISTIAVGAIVGGVIGGASAYWKNRHMKDKKKLAVKVVGGIAKGAISGALIGAGGLGVASKVRNLKYARSAFLFAKGAIQGGYSYCNHHASRMKKPIKKYIKQVGKAITYSSKMTWSNTKSQLYVSTKDLAKAAAPTKSDLAAAAFGFSVGMMNGSMTFATSGIVAKELETELVINSTSSVFSKEAFTSIAQEGFDGMVSTLFPGELS